MFIDLGKLIGGPDEGEGRGLIGGLVAFCTGGLLMGGAAAAGGAGEGAAGGVFEGFAGSGVADVGAGAAASSEFMGGAARAGAAESSFFGRLFSREALFDYYFWSDMMGNRGRTRDDFGHAWRGMNDTEQAAFKELSDVVNGHAFIRGQLERLKAHAEIAPIFTEYQALGTNLPSEELLSKAFRSLSKFLRTASGNDAEGEAIRLLNGARDALKQSRNALGIEAYEDLLRKDPGAIERLFERVASNIHASPPPVIADASRLLGGAEAEAGSFFSKLSSGKRLGLMIGGATLAGIGAYCALSAWEKKHKKDASMMHGTQHITGI